MAKRATKETSTPLIVALVFFVLTTITFGVLWYMQYSDQQAKEDAVKKANSEATAAKGEAADAALKYRVCRIFMGIPQDKDIETVKAETKGQEKVAAELKSINEALAKVAGVKDASELPSELRIWGVDSKGQPTDPPTKGLIPVVGDSLAKRDAAIAAAATDRSNYADAIKTIEKAVKDYESATKGFRDLSEALPKDFAVKLKEEVKKFEARTQEYANFEKKSQDELVAATDAKNTVQRERDRLKRDIDELQKELLVQTQLLQKKQDTFVFDEPQGKVLRRLPDGILEINLGSDALVRPGLTFTVLPYDFPEKGRQSRMFSVRVRNERGEYKSVERFIEKGTIEVIEVLGPNLSRARITSEYDPIRDGVAPGDLLYNSVWRKGSSDHIALIGIFDINGDGIDDIETVVRDLRRMGIPVDTYFDMRKRAWVEPIAGVSPITNQTRYVVQGFYPVQSANDPNRDDKTALLGAMDQAISLAQSKGAQVINFRDFFPRMGYRVKIDVPDDKINQATSPYLKGVATGGDLTKPPSP